MDITYIIGIASLLVAWILGIFAKKWSWFNNNLIPLQNLIVGLIAAFIEWIITKDFSLALTLSGIVAGGTYDIIHNLRKLLNQDG
jgi:hypothetical protein